MNAQPQRRASEPYPSHPATKLLADALTEQAARRGDSQPRAARLERARTSAVGDFVFSWQSDDGRDVDLIVYYDSNDDAKLLATELVSVDFREPTLQEQSLYEAEFESEFNGGGDLWHRVASRIWERTS